MQSKFITNYCTVRQMNDKIKMVVMNVMSYPDERVYSEKGTVNENKLDENISRARSRIFEYAYCNPWEYFVTFTLDKTKYDRYDLEKFQKDFYGFARHLNSNYGYQIKYLLIPETHKDGAWHMHGFIMGLPADQLRLFTLDEKLPEYIREKLKSDQQVFEWMKYHKKFGFCDLEPIRNQEACAKYVTKYISKSLAADVTELGAHLYYCSKGLKKAEIKAKGQFSGELNHPNFVNEYCSIKWYSSEKLPELLQSIF